MALRSAHRHGEARKGDIPLLLTSGTRIIPHASLRLFHPPVATTKSGSLHHGECVQDQGRFQMFDMDDVAEFFVREMPRVCVCVCVCA